MNQGFNRVRRILGEVPRHGKLAYCLLRDDRVPTLHKVALLAALGAALGPMRFPGWLPVLGDLDALGLAILAVKVFVEACPRDIVREHRAALSSRTSTWHRDLATGRAIARAGAGRAMENLRARRGSAASGAGHLKVSGGI